MVDSLSSLPLRRGWSRRVRAALLHAIGLARLALIRATAGDAARLHAEVALLTEELRINDTRLARIPAAKRPHYDPVERLAILGLRAARGWNTADTARRFLVTPATIASWMHRLDEDGPGALVRTARPVNRFPDFVAELVAVLRRTLPVLGKVRIAQLLARLGLHLAPSTVKRLAERRLPTPSPPEPAPARPGGSITARRPHHVWHVDLTLLPTISGWWVPWQPFSLPQRWPFCFWLAAILDRYSRSVVGRSLFREEPTAQQVCALLEQARRRAGCGPRHLTSDQGPQFRDEYAEWCRRRGVRPRFGKVGEHGSIAIIERFFRSLKQEMLRQLGVVPVGIVALRREIDLYLGWYHEHRPHQGLDGRTAGGGHARQGTGARARAPRAARELAARARRSSAHRAACARRVPARARVCRGTPALADRLAEARRLSRRLCASRRRAAWVEAELCVAGAEAIENEYWARLDASNATRPSALRPFRYRTTRSFEPQNGADLGQKIRSTSTPTGSRAAVLARGEPGKSGELEVYGNMPYTASMARGSSSARLEARLPASVHKLLKRAAQIQGRSLTDFVVAAAHEAACRTIEDAEVVRLSLEDQSRIANAILKPAAPVPALRRAFKRRRTLLGGA